MFSFRDSLQEEIAQIKAAGTYKAERVIVTPQSADIAVESGARVLNFCANNYLGLADDARLIDAAKRTLDRYGLGMASVRFICGTLDIHKDLERRIASFHGKEDSILYAAAFDANGGLFEPLLTADDAVISDALNHASIIDGVRLCKARRFRFQHDDMADLRAQLAAARQGGARRILITTDGVFSMDGDIARLDEICDLAEAFDALVHVDECHATGFFGPGGRGASAEKGVLDRVDLITSTLGKAMGGASGGFTTGPSEIIDLLRQKSRPYLFSNTLAPTLVGASLAVFDLLDSSSDLLDRLVTNTRTFRHGMTEAGFDVRPGTHPIVPVMLGDAALATQMADALLAQGIYVIGFSYPVVPKGQARIRVQISAAHTPEQLDRAMNAFITVGRELGVID
ncbi:MAG: glycine C-acetyltransferase [Deltaproteobacteria bacterium]|nr:MAG: glycine C-acetyltransferase [Deltaproteobacteria bacterium]